jgi:hypothetical protein
MIEPQKEQRPEPPLNRAEQLAVSMVQQMSQFNENMAVMLETQRGQLALLDELNGRLETLTEACKILAEQKAEGKVKITILDFAEAMAQADEEVMGEGEEEEEGGGDGTVPFRR